MLESGKGRKVAGVTRSLMNPRSLQLEWSRVLHESLHITVLMYGSEAKVWKKKEKIFDYAVQMENLRNKETYVE